MYFYMKRKGFTLIEILIVIGILSVISSVVVVSTNSSRAKARDTKRLADFSEFEAALYNYYDSYGVYPCGDNQPLDPVTGLKTLTNQMTYDSSHSNPFLDGERDTPPINGVKTSNGPSPSCNAEGTKTGIYTAGFYPVEFPKDPINILNEYLYGYDAKNDRQQYILYMRLETNDDMMKNDGGLCSKLYEQGPGLGIMTPALPNVIGNGCN